MSLRNSIICSAVKKQLLVVTGSTQLLDLSSPRSSNFKRRFEFIIANCAEDDHEKLLTNVTQQWIDERNTLPTLPFPNDIINGGQNTIRDVTLEIKNQCNTENTPSVNIPGKLHTKKWSVANRSETRFQTLADNKLESIKWTARAILNEEELHLNAVVGIIQQVKCRDLLQIKGSPDFLGVTTINRDMRGVLNEEFPKLVYTCSCHLLQPRETDPMEDWNFFVKNGDFMNYFQLLDYDTDVKEYKGGFIVNAHERLTETNTEQDVLNMEYAQAGIFELYAQGTSTSS